MRCFLVFLAVLQLAAGTEPFSKHSHHHVAASQLRTVSPLALSAFERESWLQGAFATSLHERHSSDINSCIACEVVVQLVQWAVDSNVTLDTVETLATLYCEYKKIYGGFPDVCSGMIREDGPEILYVFTHKYLDPRSVCTFLKFCTSSTPAVPPGWDSDSVLSLRPAPPARRKPRSVGTFAHISDIHLDVQYTVGCDSNCGKPLCCRPENGYPSDPSAAAQPFGEPSCDTSRALLASLADFVQTLPAVDFVVWTGDEPPHDVWEQSRSENENATAEVTDAMLRAFGDAMVFPALGNHESFPVDQFEGPGADNWLYDSVASYWSRWLPEDALNSLRYGGFYSALLPGSKLRVVSINSNFANSGNFWLLLETGDVGGQLQWLNTTLAASRAAGERVFLIAHIPWGSAIDAYAQSVHGLVEAYSDVISGQFYGHTHHDQFQVFRDNATNSKPIGISFIAPSITPYGSVFPSFRIYQYDRDTFEVLDYTSYVMNVTAANAAGTATWTEDYHLLSEYGMAGATPSDFQSLVTRMNSDSSLFERYRLHFWRQPHGSCDAGCKKDMLCDAASATGTLYDQCMAAPSTPKTALA